MAVASPRSSRRTACRLGGRAFLEGLTLLGDYLRHDRRETGAVFGQLEVVVEGATSEHVPATLLAGEELLAGCIQASHSNRLLAKMRGTAVRHPEMNLSVEGGNSLDGMPFDHLCRRKKHRNTYTGQDPDLRGWLRGFLRRRKLFDEDAIGLLDVAELGCHPDTNVALLARLEGEERRQEDDVLGGRQLHLALRTLRPGVCTDLVADRFVSIVAQDEQRLGERGREVELDRRDVEAARARGGCSEEEQNTERCAGGFHV